MLYLSAFDQLNIMCLLNLQTFETGNRYHFMHTLALLAVPMTRKPMLVGIVRALLWFIERCRVNAKLPKYLFILQFEYRYSQMFLTQVSIKL